MLRVNPKVLSDLGIGGSLISGDTDTTEQTNSVFTKLAAKKCFKDDDANGDGVITKDEVDISAAAYAKLDANSDGKVTAEELSDALEGHGSEIAQYYLTYKKAAKSSTMLENILTGDTTTESTDSTYDNAAAKLYMANKDADKNGTLEQSEVTLTAATYAKIDTNSDGHISLSEMKASLKGQDSKLAAYFKASTSTTDSTDLSSILTTTV
jgi:Ca2+-binding EF-hand superfamily protein